MAEFLAGIAFTLFIEFIGYKIYQARENRKTAGGIPSAGTSRPIKDYPRDTESR